MARVALVERDPNGQLRPIAELEFSVVPRVGDHIRLPQQVNARTPLVQVIAVVLFASPAKIDAVVHIRPDPDGLPDVD